MMSFRVAAVMLAAGLSVCPARAEEHTTFHHLAAPVDALQPCRTGMLLSLPPSWQVGDGAVVLMTVGQAHDATRDVLVSALLYEHAAVVELVPVRCDTAPPVQDEVIAGAADALDAVTRTLGGGMVVAIGYGPGAHAMLDVVGAPGAALLGPQRPRFAAAVALGDGTPDFALGEPLSPAEGAPQRLAALCRALVAVAGGMGETPERAEPASAAEACLTTMAGGLASAAPLLPVVHRQ